ncbi:MAG: response regulator [Calditrichaceae bacterium]|jgi:two-component system, cell cycle sensor histidine kinase and response regulator CckA
MASVLRVLCVDDSEDDTLLLVRALKLGGYEPDYKRVETPAEMEAALDTNDWDIVLADYSMPQFSAIDALNLLKTKKPSIPLIIVSGAIGEETAASVLREGARDFINKDNLTRLIPAIQRELRESEIRKQRERAEEDKKHIEEQLFQAQKMEAIGRLTGGVAHDFNNLLTVINGYSELILTNMPKDDQNFEHVQLIRQAGRRAENLTRQLLAFSRKQTLKPVVLDLNELLYNMEKILHRIIGEDIDLIAAYADDLRYVKADPSQLEQVILNLVINSRDSMPRGGRITIETENVYLENPLNEGDEPSQTGMHVMMAITDTGIGMDENTRVKIFEPFFTTKEKGKGTGLGLSTVYGIVKQSGGSIVVHSEPGKGSTFKVFLKAIEEDVRPHIDQHKTADQLDGKETILVVEDEGPVLNLMTKVLEQHGYTVFVSASAEEALDFLKKNKDPIDILLTDVVLPGINGHELAKTVIKSKPEITVIYMSGYTDQVIGKEGILDENTDYIQKPFSPFFLLKKLREVLDKQ